MINLLVVDDNEETRRGLRKMLQFEKDIVVIGEAINGEDCIQKTGISHPDVVLMDIEMPMLDGLQACEVLAHKYAEMGVILATMEPTIEKLQQSLVSGAKEVLVKPYSASELLSSIRRVYEKIPHPQEKKIKKTPAKIIAVFSTKGGVGVSLIAANLAVAYAMKQSKKTLLVDFDLQYGTDAIILHQPPKRTIAEWIQEKVKDEITFREYVMTNNIGLDLLAAPLSPEQGDIVSAEEARNILKLANSIYDFVIIDVPDQMTEVGMVALEQCTGILLIISTDILSINNARKAIDILRKMRYLGKVSIVLNRSNVNNLGFGVKEIEDALEYKISHFIPSDGKIAVSSINSGEPFVLKNPKCPISQAIFAMVEQTGKTKGVTQA